jgi:hypothetical protein
VNGIPMEVSCIVMDRRIDYATDASKPDVIYCYTDYE